SRRLHRSRMEDGPGSRDSHAEEASQMSPYYDTLADDIQRAKEIIEEGRMREEDLAAFPVDLRAAIAEQSGAIWGKDTYAAYQLIKSFVELWEQTQTFADRLERTIDGEMFGFQGTEEKLKQLIADMRGQTPAEQPP